MNYIKNGESRGGAMIISGTEKLYKDYIRHLKERYFFSDGILYRMCQENPDHKKQDVIIGKILLIGRTYAAAIERRKATGNYKGDDFYNDVVGPEMKKIGTKLDNRLDKLRKSNGLISDNLDEILGTHKFLMDFFNKITGLEKRSLASKYLHFHCPEKFFIYDSRARSAIRKVLRKPYEEPQIVGFDSEYVDFVYKMLELQKYLMGKGFSLEDTTPRNLDSFLLRYIDK